MEKKLNNISCIKTIMMILIVLYHSMLFFSGTWFKYETPFYNANYLCIISSWMNTFHIQVFTMASGFLFYFLKIEKNKYNTPKEDIKKRSLRLLVPYFFSSLLWVAPIAYYFFNYSFKELFVNFVLMKNPNQLWFLIMLFLVFVFFEMTSDKIKISFKNLVIIYFLSTSIGYIFSHFNITFFQLSKAAQYIFYFFLGGYIYSNKDKISSKQVGIMTIITVLLYIGYLSLNSAGIVIIHYISMFIIPIISAIEVSIIYYIISKQVNRRKIYTNNRLFKVLEENSFGIYLFHQQIIYFMIVLLNGVVHPIVQVVLSFFVSLIVSLIMSIILKKNKVTKFMFGL